MNYKKRNLNLIGVKIIGGYREQSGEEFGIFIKRVLPGGVAAQDSMFSFFFDISNKMIFVQSGNYGCFLFFFQGVLKQGTLF